MTRMFRRFINGWIHWILWDRDLDKPFFTPSQWNTICVLGMAIGLPFGILLILATPIGLALYFDTKPGFWREELRPASVSVEGADSIELWVKASSRPERTPGNADSTAVP